ncbi:PEP-CTERM sorting domain-containing protein [Vibrio eleionomae]|nr:PEP-CTERM sorting domain-containing protein [Vibrio eleionomae]
MKALHNMGKLIMLCLVVLVSSQAYAGSFSLSSLNWAIDSDGDGVIDDGSLTDIDTLNFFGYSIVHLTDADSNGTLSDGDTFTDYTYLTATDTSVDGIYTVNTLTGYLNNTVSSTTSSGDTYTYSTAYFDGSTMNWYNSDGEVILSLTVVDGSSLLSLDADGNLTVGQISLTLSISDVAEGYFYVEVDGEWVDLADLISSVDYEAYYFDVITTVGFPSSVYDSYAEAIENYSGEDIDDYLNGNSGTTTLKLSQAIADGGYAYGVSNTGTVDLASRVPEPGMLSLMGLAFIGLAGFQRRRNKKQMEL